MSGDRAAKRVMYCRLSGSLPTKVTPGTGNNSLTCWKPTAYFLCLLGGDRDALHLMRFALYLCFNPQLF